MRPFLIWSGLLAPLLFITALILASILNPGYSQIANTVSELMAYGSPIKPIMDAFFFVYAFLVLIFGVAMIRTHNTRSYRIAGISLIFSAFLGMLMILFFPTDMPDVTAITFSGAAHIAIVTGLAICTTAAMVLACEHCSWSFKAFSHMTAFIYLPAWIVTGIGFAHKSAVVGAMERFTLMLFLVWLFIYSASELMKDIKWPMLLQKKAQKKL